MAQILTLRDAEREISKLRNELDTFRSRNINLGQRRVINAHPSVDIHDYVVREELLNLAKQLDVTRISETTRDEEGYYKVTFGLNDASGGLDKTPHYFVVDDGIPYEVRATAKVAPFANNLELMIYQSGVIALDTVWTAISWTNILTTNLVIPRYSMGIHTSTSFVADTYLIKNRLLKIAILLADADEVCREVEVVLRWK